ncbi:hypothetical protein [Salinicoccus albus]|uniref:hypothetical protein n=1 Tax=Salinicoccus albus TaxID=418756 RepID=UPI0003811790|nr:hypothetical protein [Salinicoccus albus]
MSGYPFTDAELKEREKEARELVDKKAFYSSAAAAVPIPFLDIGTDMKLMNDLTDDIEEIFDLNHKQVSRMTDDTRNRFAVMATSMGSEFVSTRVTKFLMKRLAKNSAKKSFRLLPIIGQGAGALISYRMMKKLGYDHIEKCLKASKQMNAA